MKAKKTLIALVTACMVAGCALGHRIIYEGQVDGKQVRYEKKYSASLGHEPDYRMIVSFPNGEVWTMIDNNMDHRIKSGEDVVTIMKDGETKKYRGITPLTKQVIIEADELYQSILKEIKKN